MAPRYDTVTLLTDLGTADGLPGVLRSIVRSIAPHAAVVDLGHEVTPHAVREGALALLRAAQYLPPGVVLAAVGPATARPIAVEVGDGASVLLGPDDGILAPTVSLCGGAGRVVELASDEHRLPSPGRLLPARDVFAPAAAHLCAGVDLAELGPAVDPFGLFPGSVPLPTEEDDGLHAEVLWVDRFGTAQLNVDPDEVAALGDRVVVAVEAGTRTAVLAPPGQPLGPGQLGLVLDPYGLLALALDGASAADELGVHVGSAVVLRAPR